ncbi:hypothetical protein [Microbacterium lacus]|uniref:Uncharacterized protein n=1 Tax=Microbacterium lacus TaxID=415217 RepID=A0ABN2GZM4_9MICO
MQDFPEDMRSMRDVLAERRQYGWGGLIESGQQHPRYWPWVEQVESQMLLWLDGEEIEYVEFGVDPVDERASDPTAVVLTRRVLLRVLVRRDPTAPGDARINWWHVFKRDALVDLQVDAQNALPHLFPWSRRMKLSYPDQVFPTYIPIDLASAGESWPTQGRELFKSLRDDLWSSEL